MSLSYYWTIFSASRHSCTLLCCCIAHMDCRSVLCSLYSWSVQILWFWSPSFLILKQIPIFILQFFLCVYICLTLLHIIVLQRTWLYIIIELWISKTKVVILWFTDLCITVLSVILALYFAEEPKPVLAAFSEVLPSWCRLSHFMKHIYVVLEVLHMICCCWA